MKAGIGIEAGIYLRLNPKYRQQYHQLKLKKHLGQQGYCPECLRACFHEQQKELREKGLLK